MVPGQEQLTLFLIPDCKGKHSVETLDAIHPPLFIRMDDDLRVRLCPEHMTGFFQFLPQFDKIVDLTVEHDLDAAIFIPDRLCTAPEINDGKSPMPQSHFAIY